jgi:hypothetical protein
MADEYGRPPYNRDFGIPKAYAWPELKKQRGAEVNSVQFSRINVYNSDIFILDNAEILKF